MPIAAGEIQFCLTHITSTISTDPNASLGGVKTDTQIASGNSQNLFDNVSGIESRDGRTEYRCIVIFNSSAILFENARVWFNTTAGGVTNAAGDEVYMALDPVTAGVGITTRSVATELTAPTDVDGTTPLVFDQYFSADPLDVGDIPAGGHKGLWFKRVVQPNAGAHTDNTFSWTIEGEST